MYCFGPGYFTLLAARAAESCAAVPPRSATARQIISLIITSFFISPAKIIKIPESRDAFGDFLSLVGVVATTIVTGIGIATLIRMCATIVATATGVGAVATLVVGILLTFLGGHFHEAEFLLVVQS